MFTFSFIRILFLSIELFSEHSLKSQICIFLLKYYLFYSKSSNALSLYLVFILTVWLDCIAYCSNPIIYKLLFDLLYEFFRIPFLLCSFKLPVELCFYIYSNIISVNLFCNYILIIYWLPPKSISSKFIGCF